MSKTAKRLKEIGRRAAEARRAGRQLRPAVRAGSLLFVSGQLPLGPDGKLAERHKGKLKADSEIDAAREAARLCVINVLAQAHAALGDLDRVDAGGAARRVLQCRGRASTPCPRR